MEHRRGQHLATRPIGDDDAERAQDDRPRDREGRQHQARGRAIAARGGEAPAGPPELPPEYGVCDSPEQFKSKYLDALRSDARYEYVVSFVHLRKSEQPSRGGWRWHKWGEYVGEKDPQCEYLYDEPEIEEVYTFHVYRRPADTSCTAKEGA